MWQKQEFTKLTIILLLLSLFIVKPKTGLGKSNLFISAKTPSVKGDLPKNTVAERTFEKGKMRLAVEKPKPKRQVVEFEKPVTIEVASITYQRPQNTPIPVPPEDINQMIEKYAGIYNADPSIMKIIAKCESGFRQEAVNGNFGGMYQFLSSTWQSNRNAMGLDPDPSLRFNAEEAIKTAAFKMGRDGYGAWPTCHSYAQETIALNR